MSETEYSRLADKLDRISDKVVAIDEKLIGYGDLIQQTNKHELHIQRIDERCKAVQSAKEKKSINWGAVWGTVIGATILALIIKYLPI